MIDRFGPLPPYAQSLFRIAQIKLRAAALGIRKIDAGATSGYIVFEPDNQDRHRAGAAADPVAPAGVPARGPAEAALCACCAQRGEALRACRAAVA
jgi:hypothetical protein